MLWYLQFSDTGYVEFFKNYAKINCEHFMFDPLILGVPGT